ncbi:Ground-like domain-containing protein [Strongyloides ratti]|uniref:Ground-like domain-containing protein n=1 Tax=Strongyloides ratti TaxID=34506 RepID=A0A090LIY9_STRRB|nr:Ground-like domain-containing protein [Strongyloides ratti]CEF69767.1 Ground-like domain-containing protein [Strongyloides ratti]
MFGIIIIGLFLNQFLFIYPYGDCGPFFNRYNPMFLPMGGNFLPCNNIKPQIIPQPSVNNMIPNYTPCTNCNPLPQEYQENYPQPQITPPFLHPPPLSLKPITIMSQEENQQNPLLYRTIYQNLYPQQLPSTNRFLSNCKECFDKLTVLKYLQNRNIPEGDPINEQNNILKKPTKIITEYENSGENKNPFIQSLKQGLIEQETYDGNLYNNDKKDKEKIECNVFPNTTYYSPPPATSSYPTNECCVDCEEECQYNITNTDNFNNNKISKKIRRLLASQSLNTDVKCTNKQLRNILSRYIGSDAKSSVKIIQKVGDETLLEAHNVICSEGKFYYITRSSSFCQLTIGNVHCYIFRVIP